MSRSLADLIFNTGAGNNNSGSQEAPRLHIPKPNEENARLSSSSSQKNGNGRSRRKSHSSTIRDTYIYDPVDDFYDDSPSRENHHITGGADTEKERQSAGTKRNEEVAKYDFQIKMEDRDFFTSATTSTQQLQQNAAKAKKRKRSNINETKEEYVERLRQQKIKKCRSKRLLNKRYNFDNEFDYGGSITRMVKLQMDASGRFDQLITKKIKNRNSIPSEHKNSSKEKKKKRKEMVTVKLEDSESDSTNIFHGDDNSPSKKRSKSGRKNIDLSSDNSEIDSINNEELQKTKVDESNHALGSLLGRIKAQEEASLLEQRRLQEESGEIIDFNDNQELMRQHPLSYLDHGFIAPLSVDPNMQKYSYLKSTSREELGCIRANKLFYDDRSKFRNIHDDSLTSLLNLPDVSGENMTSQYQLKKIPTFIYSKKKYSDDSGDKITSRMLPINCFNPSVNRLKYPKMLDTYHYLPYSRQDPASFRMNTNRNHFVEHILSPFDQSRQFYNSLNNNKVVKSFNPLHFHSTNIHLFVARMVVSCAGLISNDTSDEDQNVTKLSRLFEMLYRKKNTTSRLLRTIRLSQELASNYAMWQSLNHKIEHLLSRKILDINDYYFLKKELLSDHSEMLCDPYAISESNYLKKLTTNKRERILKFILNLEQDDKEKNHSGQNMEELPESSNEEIDNSKVYMPMVSKAFAKTINSGISSMTRSEKFSQVSHRTELDLDTVRLTLATLYSELSLRRAKRLSNDSDSEKTKIAYNDEAEIHETILSYLEKVVNEIWFFGTEKKVQVFYKNTLNGPLAQTVLMRQSYVANSGSTDFLQIGDTLSFEKDNSKEDERMESTNFKIMAEELYSFGSNMRGDKLTIFSTIHLTT